MLYNTPRWASIRAKTNCVLFRLDRKTYHSIVNERNIRKRKIFQNSIQKC
jgi:cAMP-dependent protein kinase regulator